jgi:hypothetical protein
MKQKLVLLVLAVFLTTVVPVWAQSDMSQSEIERMEVSWCPAVPAQLSAQPG